ncbi:DUF6670 family protein [Nocardia macrotermitis]|uniref:Uncharacterized protein n=1 Tax=Nocardia macrotermitis TaxID=2585198 RepID=A0A7K0D5D2_9NOCA|nr:DUF6670 family protein [Nocardia macrotermitis]MQY20938.1 hypothetical protein [Nocardia macrotermitis]
MGLKDLVLHTAQRSVSATHSLKGTPFDPATPFHPPRGRYSTVHYGLMLPNLPAPLRFLDVIAIIGQPAVRLWANDHLVETSAADTANLLIGAGVEFPGQFRGYRVGRDLELAPDSSLVRFGEDFRLEARYPQFTVTYRNPDFEFDLRVHATDKIAHFAKFRGDLYDHWSLLCRYEGTITHGGSTVELSGLNTLEYARAVRVPLPLRFFTYHIINLDDSTQVLMVELRGPGGIPMQQAVYLRSLTDHGGTYENGFRFEVQRLEPTPRRTPNGLTMHLGKEFSWRVDDENGGELIEIHGTTNDDYVYGMAGGYVGSYRYDGHFRGEPVTGTGYIEYIGTH